MNLLKIIKNINSIIFSVRKKKSSRTFSIWTTFFCPFLIFDELFFFFFFSSLFFEGFYMYKIPKSES